MKVKLGTIYVLAVHGGFGQLLLQLLAVPS